MVSRRSRLFPTLRPGLNDSQRAGLEKFPSSGSLKENDTLQQKKPLDLCLFPALKPSFKNRKYGRFYFSKKSAFAFQYFFQFAGIEVDRTASLVDADVDVDIALLNLHKAVRPAPEAVIFVLIFIGFVRLLLGCSPHLLHLLPVMLLEISILTVDFQDRFFSHGHYSFLFQ
jgi:hypothetical protein